MVDMIETGQGHVDPNEDLASSFQQDIEAQQQEEDRLAIIAKNKKDCLEYVQNFHSASLDNRRQVYVPKWDRFSRNYHSIYDPDKKAKKADWQSCMFDPLSVTHVEVICSALAKVLMGRSKPITVEPRETGDIQQADLVTQLLDYEIDKSDFRVAFYDALKQACIYGSGFVKFFWDRKTSKRKIMQANRAIEGGNSVINGYQEQTEEVLVKDHLGCQFVDIYDVYKEPNSTNNDKIIHEDKITYGDIVEGLKYGFDEEVVRKLGAFIEPMHIPIDKQQRELTDKGKTDTQTPKTKYQKEHTLWEFWGEIPRRWINYEMDPLDPASDELVAARIWVASKEYLLFSEENEFETMEPPILQIDYIRTGDAYGKGVCELLEGIQDEINELTNQRIDNVTMIMNKMFVVIQKALVDPKGLVSQPGGGIKLKSTEDVRKAFSWVDTPDVSRSAYAETQEKERKAQEVTASNRMTTGTAGADQNKTLGGMQLLLNSAYERFTLYAYMIERGFLVKAGEWMYSLIYKNRALNPESLRNILGESPVPGPMVNTPQGPMQIPIPKWQAFQFIPTHELQADYNFKTVGTFSMGDKERKALQIMQWEDTYAPRLLNYDTRATALVTAKLLEIEDQVEDAIKNSTPINPEMMGQMEGGKASGHGGQQSGDKPTPSQQSEKTGGNTNMQKP